MKIVWQFGGDQKVQLNRAIDRLLKAQKLFLLSMIKEAISDELGTKKEASGTKSKIQG